MSTSATGAWQRLEDRALGFIESHILFAGHKLGLFECLAQEPSCSLEELASEINISELALARFLHAACILQLVCQTNSGYAITSDMRPYFLSSSPYYMGPWIEHLERAATGTLERLADSLRSSGTAGSGGEEKSVFDAYWRDQQVVQAFADSMWSIGYEASRQLVCQLDLSGFKHLVDLGGGSGSFAVAAVLTNPNLEATVFDLPPLKVPCEKRQAQLTIQERLRFQAGDFFQDPLPFGDLYALGFVLSDWTTAQGTFLLEKIFDALPIGGRLLVLERLLDEQEGVSSSALMDMWMISATNGRHRTSTDYIDWLERVGFCNCSVTRSGCSKHLITGYKLTLATRSSHGGLNGTAKCSGPSFD